MKNFFENAKFGDRFIDVEGKIWIYHYSEPYKSSDGKCWVYHWLIREPTYYNRYCKGPLFYHPYEKYVFIDGYGIPANLKYYSVEKIKHMDGVILRKR